jgi:hypothetical protein
MKGHTRSTCLMQLAYMRTSTDHTVNAVCFLNGLCCVLISGAECQNNTGDQFAATGGLAS